MNEWRKTRGEDSLTLSPNLINVDNVRFATHMTITLYKGVLSVPMVLYNDYEINTGVLTLLIKKYLRQQPKFKDNIFYCRREIVIVDKPRKNNKRWTTPIEIHLRVDNTPSVEEIEEIIKEIVRLSNEEICSYIDDTECDTLNGGLCCY
jgi:hypothetical protein